MNPGWSVDFFNFATGAPTGWLWKFYDGSSGSGYQTSADYDPIAITYYKSGKFNVSLTATNQMGTSTKTKVKYITVNPGVGIQTNKDAPTFTMHTYPNPVVHTLYVQFEDELVGKERTLTIRNSVGQTYFTKIIPAGTGEQQYDVSRFSSGMYFISVQADEVILTQKVVKE